METKTQQAILYSTHDDLLSFTTFLWLFLNLFVFIKSHPPLHLSLTNSKAPPAPSCSSAACHIRINMLAFSPLFTSLPSLPPSLPPSLLPSLPPSHDPTYLTPSCGV